MGKIWTILDGLRPMMMMVTVQIALTGVNILYKLVGSNGASLPILIAYRLLFAAATVVPLALVLERKKRPKLTWKVGFQAFVCALFGGSLAQNLYAKSLMLTSATFAAAISNLIPAITLILALIFRMEALGLKTAAGKAKLSGTLLSIGGAMLLTFYKGFQVNLWSTHVNLLDLLHKGQTSTAHVAEAHHSSANSILGLLLALGCCISVSFALIIQTKMSETYPCHYSSTALISVVGSFQAIVYALCVEKDMSKWRLGWNLTLLTAAYMGVFASGMMWVFIMLCVRMRGPLYVSVFNPLLLVLVALAGSLFLNEKLHLGSLLGAVVIICGLYLVLWGKGKEMKEMARSVPSKNDLTMPETARESFKGFIHANNVVVVTPTFVPEIENSRVFDDYEGDDEEEEEEEDLEAKVSSNNSKP